MELHRYMVTIQDIPDLSTLCPAKEDTGSVDSVSSATECVQGGVERGQPIWEKERNLSCGFEGLTYLDKNLGSASC